MDGAAVRRTWDAACALAQSALRDARDAAEESWITRWLTVEIGQLTVLQAMVDGKRLQPGSTASGLFYDVPPDLQADAYAEAMAAVSEVDRLYRSGLDAGRWDWTRGFPPGWPASLKDRIRAYLPTRRA